jgi:Kef-type K+ transport system membrane component KefB
MIHRTSTSILLLVIVILLVPAYVASADQQQSLPEAISTEGAPASHAEEASHGAPFTEVLVTLLIVLLGAKLGGELMERIHQPAVLGELIFGVLLGNVALFGYHGLEYLKTDLVFEILAEIGVILLLFEVGLETNLRDMMRVGISSLLVALFGVIAPMFLGYFVSVWFMPNASVYVHIYIGAVLCATSVGITARVLQDLGKLQATESRIILGAAVFDDVMGLIVLAAMVGVIEVAKTGGNGIPTLHIVLIIGEAIVFFVGAILIGILVSPHLFRIASYLRVRGMLLTTSLLVCFLFAFLAKIIGLAYIVGAFAAGLIMEDVHYKNFLDRGEHDLEELLRPLTIFLVPLFFVRMGVRVDLTAFANVNILGFAAMLTFAAIVGKQVCSLGVMEKGLDRISIGVGMIPRGEVGLIVANIGTTMYLAGSPVVNSDTFSAVVIMVIVTTMVTPPVLKYTLAAGDRRKARLAEQQQQPST